MTDPLIEGDAPVERGNPHGRRKAGWVGLAALIVALVAGFFLLRTLGATTTDKAPPSKTAPAEGTPTAPRDVGIGGDAVEKP